MEANLEDRLILNSVKLFGFKLLKFFHLSHFLNGGYKTCQMPSARGGKGLDEHSAGGPTESKDHSSRVLVARRTETVQEFSFVSLDFNHHIFGYWDT